MSKQKIELGEELLEFQNAIKALKSQLSKLTIDPEWAKKHSSNYMKELQEAEFTKAKKKQKDDLDRLRKTFYPKEKDIECDVEDWFNEFRWIDEEVDIQPRAVRHRGFGSFVYDLTTFIQENKQLKDKLKGILGNAKDQMKTALKEAVEWHFDAVANEKKNVSSK